ncbi:ABC transporter ATP-binding protein [Cellulosilyticum lentocellum]|uniref:Xenobiotic-transporting ATPase n=1 Tax=Cellulosilyticum lentocellum (strain ATCC 49066 / DSM 5427 / NCIMB 11756 / RHM5) TaxID=642492 RepID=F2JIA7_CELLD|nr:ABC transporter ATP-binding protein [Cellulosilyticum lentocellum]ADZ84273.1 Xenobiotic-transporting ATPase [Cellulosilyticum lentocellum DSM 5427]
MLKIMKYLKPYIGYILLAVGLLFTQAMCDLSLPDYMSKIINQGILMKDNGFILQTGGIMLLISLGGVIAAILVGLIASKVGAGVARTLRRHVFEKVSSFSNAEFDKFSTASLITRTTNDITQIQNLVTMMIRMMFYAPIMGVGGIILALSKDVSMSWIIILAVVILIGLIVVISIIVLPRFKKVQSLIDKLNLIVRENLSGMLVIRAFNTQKFEEKRFDEANKDLMKVNLFVNRVMTFMMPAMMLLMNLISVLVIWVGSHRVGAGQLEVGDMMAFMQYTMQIIMSFLFISMMFIMIPRASVSGRRVSEVLETELTIIDQKNALPIEKAIGVIEFKNVSFSYPGAEEPVLHDVSFVAKPGETTAFIGATGSGKSTLINLVPRFYDVTEGSILLDGKDIRDIAQHDLREQIGYVPQKGILFSGTIESNLSYGKKDASEKELLEAATIAQAKEFIDLKPEGMKSGIAQGGTNVSGGQKQRLSIARALATKPQIYIFDDSFSALDFKTDAQLRAELKKNVTNATVLLVAQRISTIMHAEQIIVLDEGHVVGKGTHQELLKTCEVYKEIALSQLSKEELGNE